MVFTSFLDVDAGGHEFGVIDFVVRIVITLGDDVSNFGVGNGLATRVERLLELLEIKEASAVGVNQLELALERLNLLEANHLYQNFQGGLL